MSMKSNTNSLTINDIANSLGLSKTTVSRAISGKGRVSKSTRERVLKYVKSENYQPNVIAKSLAEQKTFNIGVVLPRDSNSLEMPFFQKCLMGISESAAKYNYDVVVIMADNDDIRHLERVIENRKVDGFINTRVLLDDLCVKKLKDHFMPLAVIGSYDDKEVIQIDHDHRKATAELVEGLIVGGKEKIAFVGENLSSSVNINRYQGYVDALKERGIEIDSDMTYFFNDRNKVEEVVNDIIEKSFDCIVCMDDFICSAVLTTLEKMSVKKNNIHVASLYNTLYLEKRYDKVSSINFNITELGKIACEKLLHFLKTGEIPNKTLLDYDVMIKL